MSVTSKRAQRVCVAKVRYATWQYAEAEGVRIWRTRDKRPNPATPYPCSLCDGYHLALSPVVRRKRTR